jgi:hypothetical protein
MTVDELVAVLRVHQGPFFHGTHTRCGCRRIVQTADEWARHVAEEQRAAETKARGGTNALVDEARSAADCAESDSWPTYFDVGLTRRLADELERLRSYKSLPPGMVWQDYYSPEDVIALRSPLDAEIERLRKITDIIDPDSVYREQRDQAWAERDAANAEVERLRAVVNALKVVIEHVDDRGEVPMAYILRAQTTLAALEADR